MRQLFKKLTFSAPSHADVLVFDATNSPLLAQTVLRDIPHTVLETRLEKVYIAPSIAWGMIVAASSMHWRYICNGGQILRRLRGELYTLYLYACVRAARPRIVLTFIDNSIHFQLVSRRHISSLFFAIQNGVRSEFNLAHDLVPEPHPAHRISMPYLFCFGDYESKMYRRFGHLIDCFDPVGSIKAGYYLSVICKQRPPIEFDLCVASQWVDDVMLRSNYPEIRRSLEAMDALIRRYLEEHAGLVLSVALRQNDPEEVAYFRKAYGDRAMLIERTSDGYSSYSAVDRSKVTLLLDSTIGREAYGWGKKVLFCNFTGIGMYHTEAHDWCHTDQSQYEHFSIKLTHLLEIDDRDYLRATSENRAFLMRSDPDFPAHLEIAARIKAELGLAH